MGIKTPKDVPLNAGGRQMPPKLAKLMRSRSYNGSAPSLGVMSSSSTASSLSSSSIMLSMQLPQRQKLSRATLKKILIYMLVVVFALYVAITAFVALRHSQQSAQADMWQRRQERLHLEPATMMMLQQPTELTSHLQEHPLGSSSSTVATKPINSDSDRQVNGPGGIRMESNYAQTQGLHNQNHVERIRKVSSASKEMEQVELEMIHPHPPANTGATIRKVYVDNAAT